MNESGKPESENRQDQQTQTTHQRDTSSRQEKISWRARESNAGRKSGDWYFILWTIAFAGAAISVILGNILFALLIVISAFTLSVTVSKTPSEIEFEVSTRGIKAGATLYPYSSLSAFNIASLETDEPFLILEPAKPLGFRQVLPITPEVDIELLRDLLLAHLKEEELDIPLANRVADSIGV